MVAIDIILGALLLFTFYKGLKQGLFKALASLVGLVAGLVGAIYLSKYTANYLKDSIQVNEQTLKLIAFGITFLGILILVSLSGKWLTKIADFASLGSINKIAGGLFNMLKYGFIISVLFMFMNTSSTISNMIIPEETKEESLLYKPVASFAPMVLPHILKKANQESEDELQPDDSDPPIQDDIPNDDF